VKSFSITKLNKTQKSVNLVVVQQSTLIATIATIATATETTEIKQLQQQNYCSTNGTSKTETIPTTATTSAPTLLKITKTIGSTNRKKNHHTKNSSSGSSGSGSSSSIIITDLPPYDHCRHSIIKSFRCLHYLLSTTTTNNIKTTQLWFVLSSS
jgi:hypothetical protein